MKGTLQPRDVHSSTAINISSTLTEVIMFGGQAGRFLADTTVLQFSEWCEVDRMCIDERESVGYIGRLKGRSRDKRHE